MNRTVHVLAFVMFGGLVPLVAQAAPPSADEAREAVARSLPFLEKEGVAWMQGKACVTCHQIPSMVWSFNEARRHGLPVDSGNLARWNRWAVDNALKRAVYFKLTDDGLKQLGENGVPDDVLAKLATIKDRNYVFEADYRSALASHLSPDVMEKRADVLLKVAARPGQGGSGGGENNQYAATLLSGAALDSADASRELVARLVKTQNKDGSWAAAGQFRAQQRPRAETLEVVTLWTVLVLTDVPDPTADVAQSLAKAREYLKQAGAGTNNIETLVLRAMLAAKDGDKEQNNRWISDVVAHQHADGGWGWLKDRQASDPFTTGLVLYGLACLGRGAADPAVAQARAYLLSAQDESGAWKIGSKTISANTKEDTKAGDAIYTYWATGWAVVGLLATLEN